MTGSTPEDEATALLVDSLKAADREMAKAEARRAQLMVQFADARKKADAQRIAGIESCGGEPRYKPGEFAAMEIGLAVTESKHRVRHQVATARRLRAEAPDAWDAWFAGDINEAKAIQISAALRKLVRDDSKKMLNLVVVAAAIPKTPELLRRWLNRFIARIEPDRSDERIRRSVEDRYVSVRPDLDGVSFLSACLPSLDAASVDLVLDALVGIAGPGDPRTKPQQRADAMVDLLLGRISNGWHAPSCAAGATAGGGDNGCGGAGATDAADGVDAVVGDASGGAAVPEGATGIDRVGEHTGPATTNPTCPASIDTSSSASAIASTDEQNQADRAWDADDWDLPAGAFRPDPNGEPADDENETPPEAQPVGRPAGSGQDTPRTGCCGAGAPPPRITIGVVVSIQSLFGFTDTPGELADGSAHVPASIIRELAGQPGTLFYRLLTDPTGNLLDVTETGRFPSEKLATAVRFRDGVCTNPACHASAGRCDLDHVAR